LTDWQLDALFRQRALENAQGAKDTLLSTVKLVDQIENMPVDQFVQKDVQDALNSLKLVRYCQLAIID
jgi:phosphatidylinositol glycan class S